jgi:GNAT superfamily N-acetyltransferase
MTGMTLMAATEADFAVIVGLANWAYRGDGQGGPDGWNVESGFLAGQRMDESLLREELAAKPLGHLLTLREEPGGEVVGTVWLNPEAGARGDFEGNLVPRARAGGVWSLGLLAVRPDMQNRRLGSAILAAAEEYARRRGARRIRMTVIYLRTTLIAWYQRRGYAMTGQTEPFPYGDERYGRPLREDLYFAVLEKEIGDGARQFPD